MKFSAVTSHLHSFLPLYLENMKTCSVTTCNIRCTLKDTYDYLFKAGTKWEKLEHEMEPDPTKNSNKGNGIQ